MRESLLALLIFLLSGILLYYIFRPVRGWYWLIRDGLKNKKTIIEDILKEIYTLEQQNLSTYQERVREHLQIPQKFFLKVLDTMQERDLIKKEDNLLHLTANGRDYALQIVRAHRLYEKYLAEKTGYSPSEWHVKAEQMEHHLQGKKLEAIVSQVGDPRYDPHGDPIPTSKGNIKELEGLSLPEIKPHTVGRIVHIEDEPLMVYRQILAEDIHVGAIIRVVSNSKDKIEFYSEGEDFSLIPEIAKNITILPLENPVEEEKNSVRLSSLQAHEEAEVISISRECRGANRRRLLDLGFVKGSKVSVDLTSPTGNPRAYLIRHASIALRSDQAKHILIKKLPVHV